MLVLGIEENEKVKIGKSIYVHFFRHKRNGLKMCIEAPREIEVTRMSGKFSCFKCGKEMTSATERYCAKCKGGL